MPSPTIIHNFEKSPSSILESDEYFYRRRSKRNQVTTDDTQSSTDSSLSSNEARMGDVDEFENMYQHYRQTDPDT